MVPHKLCYIHFDCIDSTNTWAKKNASELDPNLFTCITAQKQSAGRGRFERKWISPKGENILATLFFTLTQGYPYLANLAQILSLSAITVLKKNGFYPLVKWPNDILLNHKKLAGVLCETVGLEGRIGIALGIGLNVNMSDESLATIDQPATSLYAATGKKWGCEQILKALLEQFLIDLEQLTKNGFAPFCKGYEELLVFKGKRITCMDGQTKLQGICHSINSDGTLNLQLPNAKLKVLIAGTIQEG